MISIKLAFQTISFSLIKVSAENKLSQNEKKGTVLKTGLSASHE